MNCAHKKKHTDLLELNILCFVHYNNNFINVQVVSVDREIEGGSLKYVFICQASVYLCSCGLFCM